MEKIQPSALPAWSTQSVSRRGFLVAAGALGLTAAAACGGGGGSSDALRFWKTPVGELKFEKTFNEEAIAAFKKAKNGTDVDLLIIPWDNALTKYTAGYAGSSPPDLAYEILPWLNKFRSTGALADLNKVGGSATDKYFEGLPESVAQSAAGDGGERFGLPFSAGHFGLTLNEEIWEQAGSPALPTTYEEVIPFAQKLTFDKNGKALGEDGFDANNIANYGFVYAGVGSISTNYVWHYLWSYGADLVSEDQKGIGFDNDEGRAALKHIKALVDSGACTPLQLYSDPEKWGDLMLEGKAALQWMPNINPTQETKYKTRFKALDLPSGPAGTFVVGGVGYFSIASKSERQKDAFAFAEFLLEEKRRKDYITSIRVYPFGDVPADYYSSIADPRTAAYLSTVAGQTKFVRLTPVLPYDPQDYLIGKFNDYFLGRASLDDMIKETAAQVKTMAETAK